MLVLISSWCLNTYLRLHKTASKYESDNEFSGSCGMSKEYVNAGIIISITFLVIGAVSMIVSSVTIYRG
jgi:TRAP-type mannitol/chloroaromatic compound transport system permease small subunit